MIAALRDLTERIAEGSQESFATKSSWFGKKTNKGDNFWKSLETNLTKFVAGDEAPEDSVPNGKKSLDVQDPRFGRIASDTSLNRMASLPNLRGQATTPVYTGFGPEVRGGGSHSRYSTVTSESRYTPSARYEQGSVRGSIEYDRARSAGGSGVASPEPTNGPYSPYIPQAPLVSEFLPPEEPVAPAAPVLPSAPAERAPKPPAANESEKPATGHEKKRIFLDFQR
jgi:hypothetical protein